MDYLGKFNGFETYYLDLAKEDYKTALPVDNWFCCAIANIDFDDSANSLIAQFIRTSIDQNILSWHGLGAYGDKLHLTFDWIMVSLEVDEGYDEIDVCTLGQDEDDISALFWACYYAPCLPERANHETTKLICVSFDSQDYKKELIELMAKFENGWLPND